MYSIPASQRSDVASTAESVGSELARPAEREPVPQAAVSWSRRTRTLLGVQVLGTGSYVPETIVSNEDLKRERGFDPQWIEQRTGILARRHLPAHLATSDMCIAAARRALDRSNVRAEDIDLVVVGTFTPDYQCPTTANLVQSALGIDAPAFDLQAACSGFVYALATAAQFVATGNSHRALVIGADCNSRIVDQSDQKIAPLFGDGAGAVVLGRGDAHQGLMCYQLGSDGTGGPMLDRPVGGTKSPLTAEDLAAGRHLLRMDGRNVFKWAVRAVVESIDRVLHQSGMRVEDVDLFVLHQANIRIINNVAEQLAIPPEKLFNNLARYGNTSAGSVPLALDEAVRGGRIGQGSTVLMAGFGAGLTWGTCLFNW